MKFLKIMFDHFFSLHENRDGHIAGLMEAKPEELGNICPNRKDVPFYVLQFCIHAHFLSVQSLRHYEFKKKKCLFTFFPLHGNHDGHLAGLMEAKPEEIGTICQNRKDVPFYVLQFCIQAHFLSVQSLRHFEFFKK